MSKAKPHIQPLPVTATNVYYYKNKVFVHLIWWVWCGHLKEGAVCFWFSNNVISFENFPTEAIGVYLHYFYYVVHVAKEKLNGM